MKESRQFNQLKFMLVSIFYMYLPKHFLCIWMSQQSAHERISQCGHFLNPFFEDYKLKEDNIMNQRPAEKHEDQTI
jgi:hypothetical protein